jgi:hypothetical protein
MYGSSQADVKVLMLEKLFIYGLTIDGLIGEFHRGPVKLHI